jgi:pyrroloquinoline-quinone synthase
MIPLISELREMIASRKKMTSPLYKLILSGNAPQGLLRNFVIHRYPIKSFWTRNILGIASQVADYELRVPLVENILEEETGYLTKSERHLNSFAAFGRSVGVQEAELTGTKLLPETKAVIDHNVETCNGGVHFTGGVASVLLLMEGQPPILSQKNESMLAVMRDVYRLPESGYDYFVHHASSEAGKNGVSELEDEHAAVAEKILIRYCTTPELQDAAKFYLSRAIERRHAHFDAIFENFYEREDPPFRYQVKSFS